MLRSSKEPALMTSLNCGYILSSWGNFFMEGCATILSAPPKMATSCVVPPLQVMAMRSMLSGMVNSFPLASMTMLLALCAVELDAALDELAAPSLEHPPRAMVPVDTTPAAMSNSTKRRRLMVFAGCWRCWVMGIPFCWGVTKRLAMRLCTWSRRILRLRNGVLLRRNWRACRLSGFLHRRCGLSRCVWRQVRPKAPWAPGRKGRI